MDGDFICHPHSQGGGGHFHKPQFHSRTTEDHLRGEAMQFRTAMFRLSGEWTELGSSLPLFRATITKFVVPLVSSAGGRSDVKGAAVG